VSIDGLSFNLEDDVSKRGIVYDLTHVQNKRVDSLVIDFVFFKLAYIEDADVI
jgi:hypothetical protein